MLKSCDGLTVEVFSLQVISFINPNFENSNFNDPYSDASLNKQKIVDFAAKSKLTPKEFMNALELVPRGELTTPEERPNGEQFEKPLKLYSKIDSKSLIEIETAYIRYKAKNKLYEKGKTMLLEYLKPAMPETTDEEKETVFLQFLKEEFTRLQSMGYVLGSTVFYDLIRSSYKTINLVFVENFLKDFKPEVFEEEKRSTDFHLASSKKVIKKEAFLSFKELFISKYILKLELKKLSETEWIEHWKTIKKATS